MHSECLVMVAGPRSIGPGDNDSRTSVSGDQQKVSNLSYSSQNISLLNLQCETQIQPYFGNILAKTEIQLLKTLGNLLKLRKILPEKPK